MIIIDPASLTRGQRKGRRCAIPNCRRLLPDEPRHQIGQLPDGQPVNACDDCAPAAVVTGPLNAAAERLLAS